MYWRLNNYVIYYCLIAQTLKYVFIISCYLVNVNIQLIKYRNAFLLAAVICMNHGGCGEPGGSVRRDPAVGGPGGHTATSRPAPRGHGATELVTAAPNLAGCIGRAGKAPRARAFALSGSSQAEIIPSTWARQLMCFLLP